MCHPGHFFGPSRHQILHKQFLLQVAACLWRLSPTISQDGQGYGGSENARRWSWWSSSLRCILDIPAGRLPRPFWCTRATFLMGFYESSVRLCTEHPQMWELILLWLPAFACDRLLIYLNTNRNSVPVVTTCRECAELWWRWTPSIKDFKILLLFTMAHPRAINNRPWRLNITNLL